MTTPQRSITVAALRLPVQKPDARAAANRVSGAIARAKTDAVGCIGWVQDLKFEI